MFLLANGGATVGIVFGVLGGLAIIAFLSGLKIVRQSTSIVVERLGKYHKTLETGVHIIIPFIDRASKPISLKEMVADFKKNLPPYAIPVFLRIQKTVETTGTFKYQKNKLKEENFDLNKTSDRLLVLLPGATAYCELTPEIYTNIEAYQYRF